MNTAGKLLQLFWRPGRCSVRCHPYPASYSEMLRNQPELEVSRLCNGLTVATEPRDAPHAAIGLYADAGSRYESDFENGITHFFEHIAYKGTCTRSKAALHEQMACTGARFRSATTRELAAHWAECLADDAALVVDLLADCVFNNCMAPGEIERQKKIVYAEMLEHDRDTDLVLADYLHSAAFQGTPLANTVMGPSTNLYNFNDGTINTFMRKVFDPSRVVLAAVGGVTHEQMVYLAELYLGKFETSKCVDSEPYRFTGSDVKYRDDSLPLVNVAMAFEAPSFCDDERWAMEVAAAALGGWDRSMLGGPQNAHRLARAGSMERLCDAYKPFYIKYKDTGLWGIQFAGRMICTEDIIYNIQNEWMTMCTSITEAEVARARHEAKTRATWRRGGAGATCGAAARWVLRAGRRPALLDELRALDAVRAQDVRAALTEHVYDRCPCLAAVGPVECVPDYTRLRAGQYWLRY